MSSKRTGLEETQFGRGYNELKKCLLLSTVVPFKWQRYLLDVKSSGPLFLLCQIRNVVSVTMPNGVVISSQGLEELTSSKKTSPLPQTEFSSRCVYEDIS